MAPTIVILAGRLVPRSDRPDHRSLAAALLADTVAVARSVRGARVLVLVGPEVSSVALDGLAPSIVTAPIGGQTGADLAEGLALALRGGEPALLVGGDLPHLPPWRLRDALTYLDDGADAVLGPADTGDWYLLGLRALDPALLQLLPGRGETPAPFVRGARQAHTLVTLPPWFAVRDQAALAALVNTLRTMPPEVAPATRALLDLEFGVARAVGG